MREIEYGYGIMGYALRYAGPLVFVFMIGVFLFVDYLILANLAENGLGLDVAFLFATSIVVIPICLGSAWMCVMYGRSLTRSYTVGHNTFKVFEKGRVLSSIDIGEAEIRYRWPFITFLIFHDDLDGGAVAIMNNARHESIEFSSIKEVLLSMENTTKVIW